MISLPKHIERLSASFEDILCKPSSVPLVDDEEYMRLTELRFVVKNVREQSAMQLYQSYSKSNMLTLGTSSDSIKALTEVTDNIKQTIVDADDLGKKIDEIDSFLTKLNGLIADRLDCIDESANGNIWLF